MASFEKSTGSPKIKNDPGQKLPLKRFEPAIYRFTKIAIPTDLDRLERHKYNIEKYIKWKNWSKFDVERINAERTIKQLKANIQDINTIKCQVAENEVKEFDNKINAVKTKALDEIRLLQELIQSVQDERDDNDGSDSTLSLSLTTSNADFPLETDNGKNLLVVREMEKKPIQKTNLQRFDVTLRTFTRITIPTALERLRMHCVNMEKYYDERLWRELNAEQVNAEITVQHLKESIQDIEQTRKQVPLNGLSDFDRRVGPSYDKALTAIDSFMKFQTKYNPVASVAGEENIKEDDDSMGLEMHGKLFNEEIAPDEATVHSWDDLQKSLVELNDIIHDFSHLVHEQQSAVDTIESNIEHAQVNVHEATHEIGRAAKIQGMLLPAVGAVVGGVVGGPVGMLAGFKAATLLTAVGGGVIGYKATSYIKNKRNEAVDSELEKLTDGNNPDDVCDK